MKKPEWRGRRRCHKENPCFEESFFKKLTKLSCNSYMYDLYTLKKYLLIVSIADV